MTKHGIYATERATSVAVPVVAESGLPFVIGAAPVQAAANPAPVGVPVLVESYADFVDKFGWSDDWDKYGLCEFAYSQFLLYGMAPIVICNLLDPATASTSVSAADKDVVDHKVELPAEAIDNSNLVVKAAGGAGSAYVKDTDYAVYYEDGKCIIELLSDGAAYSAESVNVAYKAVNASAINASAVATGLEKIELCATTVGRVPDLIVAPGFSDDATVAAVMATKAASLNGVFKCKALIDLDCATATDFNAAISKKTSDSLVDDGEIVCWPKLTNGGKTFHFSTLLAGLIAQVDAANEGVPYETPSNKALKCDGMVTADGTVVNLTHAQANTLNNAGIVTALNFLGGWVAWGNYTACYPTNTDVKDCQIPVARVFAWVRNTIVKTFWKKLDKPMNRRLVDSIVDDLSIWLNGLIGGGYLLGARVEFTDDENPAESLMAGIAKFHVYITPPSAAQELDFVIEYDVNYLAEAFGA